MTKLLYSKDGIIARLHKYFEEYFNIYSTPTAITLFTLAISIIAIESTISIRTLYRHFLPKIIKKSLNAFYYVCSYAKIDCLKFMNITVRKTLSLISEEMRNEPIFLCVDDTMISKSGTKFENITKLFDHAAHNGSNYLNGHCFVSLMLSVTIMKDG